eukprot:TRINITY_DN4061_c0_g1_i3.p1 TRINITY_DN4061_c0_g1~~TRINITY_DN4061_c0_g1_i3.p1  ORF type:complete len:387 (-),score=32.15 TRINITY_DN4061_c0_g1_i3:123-1283(-)
MLRSVALMTKNAKLDRVLRTYVPTIALSPGVYGVIGAADRQSIVILSSTGTSNVGDEIEGIPVQYVKTPQPTGMGLALGDTAKVAPMVVQSVQQQYELEIMAIDGVYLWATGTAGTLVALGLPDALRCIPDELERIPVIKIPSTRPFGCGGISVHTLWPVAACKNTIGGQAGRPLGLNLAFCTRVRLPGDPRQLVLTAGHCAVLPPHPPKWPINATGPEPQLFSNDGSHLGELVKATVGPSVDAAIFALTGEANVPEYPLAHPPLGLCNVKLVTPGRSATGTLLAVASSVAEYNAYPPWTSVDLLRVEAIDVATQQIQIALGILRLRDPIVALFPEGGGLRPGESGSVLMDENGCAIGLAVAGSQSAHIAICIPMVDIRDHFGLCT